MSTRLSRLSSKKRKKVNILLKQLSDENISSKNDLMAEFGDLMTEADAFNPITLETRVIECQYELHRKLWKEAKTLRKSKKLLDMGKRITCPTLIIHGDYDPHPIEGIRDVISPLIKNIRVNILEKCGHLPWIEKYAKDKFFKILKKEIETS